MRRLGRFAVVAGAGVLVLSMFGCTPDEPGRGSTPDPAPSSSAASPTESDEDRAERERGEHAIEVYKASTNELDRLLHAGEAKPSAEFEKYAADPFLDAVATLLHQVFVAGEHLEGEIKQGKIWVDGTATKEKVLLVSCEDGTDSYFVDEDGNRLEGREDAAVQIQHVQVAVVDDETWKVTEVETENYASFEGTECG